MTERTLRAIRDWLTPELELLVLRPEATRPFLVVQEIVTTQFFQFSGSRSRRLLIEIPQCRTAPTNVRDRAAAERLFGAPVSDGENCEFFRKELNPEDLPSAVAFADQAAREVLKLEDYCSFALAREDTTFD